MVSMLHSYAALWACWRLGLVAALDPPEVHVPRYSALASRCQGLSCVSVALVPTLSSVWAPLRPLSNPPGQGLVRTGQARIGQARTGQASGRLKSAVKEREDNVHLGKLCYELFCLDVPRANDVMGRWQYARECS